jgi:hypothetical protein
MRSLDAQMEMANIAMAVSVSFFITSPFDRFWIMAGESLASIADLIPLVCE